MLKTLEEKIIQILFIYGKYFSGLLFVAHQFKMVSILKMVLFLYTHEQGYSLRNQRTIQRLTTVVLPRRRWAC